METELERIDKEIKKLEEQRLFLVNQENHTAIVELIKRNIDIYENDCFQYGEDTEENIQQILEVGIGSYSINLVDAIKIIRNNK